MKILVIARGFPTIQDSANGNFEYEQALALSCKGVEVVVAYIDRRTHCSYKRIQGLFLQQVEPVKVYGGFLKPVVTFRYFPLLSSWVYKKRFIRLYKKIVQKEGSFDLVHCHYLFNLPPAVAIGKHYGVPIVETEHWSDLKKKPIPNYVLKLSRYYYNAKKIVTVSLALQKTLFENFGVESSTIYNMVANDYLDEGLRVLEPKGEKKRLVSIGSLIHRKGFDLLIEALSHLKDYSGEWQLQIIGDGALRAELEELIKEKSLQNNIILLGRKNKEEIRTIFHNSDFFVLPSRSETFGVVYIEAMACGLPVIATRCGGPEEFVTSENGLLIDVDDVDGLIKALEEMLRNCRKYNADRIKQLCREKFSSQMIAEQYIQVYNEVIKNK